MPLDMILIDFPPGSSNKGATKAPGNPCCNIFHSYSRKSFFSIWIYGSKKEKTLLFFMENMLKLYDPHWWPVHVLGDLQPHLVTSPSSWWSAQKLGWFWRNLLCSFEYWRFFLSKTNNFSICFYLLCLLRKLLFKLFSLDKIGNI